MISTTWKQKFTLHPSHWIKLSLLLLLVAVLSAIAWVHGAGWLDTDRVAQLVEDFGPLAPIAYIILRIVAVLLIIPSLPLDAMGGAIFGPFWGTLYSVCGSLAGGLIAFLIARSLGREAITRMLKKDIAFCNLCTERQLIYVIFFARLLPMVSFDLISYGAGLTNLSLRGYTLATLFGLVPLTFAVSYSGKSFFSADRTSLVLGAIAVVLFFVIPIWIKHRNPWGLYERITNRTCSE